MLRSGQNQVEVLLSFSLPILCSLRKCGINPTSALLVWEDRRRKAQMRWLSKSTFTVLSRKPWLSSKTRARTQQGYFYTSLKFMYNPTEICGFRPSTDLHLNASLEEKEWCYLWNYSGLPLALALNSTAPAPRAYLATKNQPEGPNQFIRANKQFKASSS